MTPIRLRMTTDRSKITIKRHKRAAKKGQTAIKGPKSSTKRFKMTINRRILDTLKGFSVTEWSDSIFFTVLLQWTGLSSWATLHSVFWPIARGSYQKPCNHLAADKPHDPRMIRLMKWPFIIFLWWPDGWTYTFKLCIYHCWLLHKRWWSSASLLWSKSLNHRNVRATAVLSSRYEILMIRNTEIWKDVAAHHCLRYHVKDKQVIMLRCETAPQRRWKRTGLKKLIFDLRKSKPAICYQAFEFMFKSFVEAEKACCIRSKASGEPKCHIVPAVINDLLLL